MRRAGFNMVEVLIALTLVGIISIAMVSFVNDHHQRYRLAVARADLNRISEAIQLAEQKSGQRVTKLSEPQGGITSMLAPYLLEIPQADPWGNRYAPDPANVGKYIPAPVGDPYVIDMGLGRLIAGGPDGEINTPIGHDPADYENDLVVEFRRRPWLCYAGSHAVGLATADSAVRSPIPPVVAPATAPNLLNITISPDGTWYSAIKDGATLVVGPIDETSTLMKSVLPRPPDKPQPELPANLAVSGDTFPLFFPNSRSILFIANKDLYRYDIGLDRVMPLTTGGFFGASDSASGSRFMTAYARGSTYSFSDQGGATYQLAISVDGKIAFSHPGQTGSGIYLVSASGMDAKMLKGTDTSNGLLPIAFSSADTLIYMTNPSVGTAKFFSKIRLDGRDEGIHLHSDSIPTGISLPVLSPDGNVISFFTSDSQGALLRTDGSGFLSPTPDHKSFNPFSWAAGIDSSVIPIWSQDAQTEYFVARDGTIVRLHLAAPTQVETIDKNSTGTTGFKPKCLELNTDETLVGLVSSNPSGLYIVPLLGPPGARTTMPTAPLFPGETPVVRWLDHQ